MYVDPNQRLGSRGERRVAGEFEDLGWAPAVKIPLDIGDDLITFARASIPAVKTSKTGSKASPEGGAKKDVSDLNAPVLIQVKSSETKYSKPKAKLGTRQGWWFYESAGAHFDHWLRFDLAYLLVLHDESSKQSYWAHVTNDDIVPAGNKRKLFVPADQRINEASLDALNRVAVAAREEAAARLRGDLFKPLTPGQRWRHALLVPVTVASPERTPTKVSPELAVALLMQGRRFDLQSVADRGGCPEPGSWRTHKTWGWQFVHALWRVLEGNGEPSSLARLSKNAPTRYQADACEVVRGGIAYVEQRTVAAANRFQPATRSHPVDRAWMHAQRAHSLLEVTDYAGAKEAADTALACLQGQAGDRTIGVIRAAATTALYTAAAVNGPDDASEAARRIARSAQENLSSQWRATVVSDALGDDLTKTFEAWGGTRTRTLGGVGNAAVRDLTSAAWSAAFGGAWGSWRQLTMQASVVALTTSVDVGDVNAALTSLTRTGVKKQTRTAASWIWLNGPVAALERNVADLAANPWSLRTEGPVMEVFAAAGDLLSADDADKVIDRILTTMRKQGPVRRLGGGWSQRWSEAEKAFRRLLIAASPKGHEDCARVVIELFGDTVSSADSVVRVANALRLDDLSRATLDALVAVASSREDQYRVRLLEVLAPNAPTAKDALGALGSDGDRNAVRALLVVGARTDDNWIALGKASAPVVTEMLNGALGRGKDGARSYGFGGAPTLHDLALSAFHTRNFRHWTLVTSALDSGALLGEQMSDCVAFLASNFSALPPTVQRRLKKASTTMRAVEHGLFDSDEFDAALFALRLAAGHLSDGDTLAGLLETRQNAGVQFARFVGGLPTADRHAFLLACTVDQDPQVRAAAGYSVVSVAHEEPQRAEALAVALLKSLDLNDGCRMPVGVAAGLKQFSVKEFGPVRDKLRTHPSAAVRRHVT